MLLAESIETHNRLYWVLSLFICLKCFYFNFHVLIYFLNVTPYLI